MMENQYSPISRRRQRGQSMVEYAIVTGLAVLVLVEGGTSAPVAQIVKAIKSAYEGFVFAISLATNLNIF